MSFNNNNNYQITNANLAALLPPHTDNVDEECHRVRLALQTIFSQGQSGHVSAHPNEWYTQPQLADRYVTSLQSQPIAWMVCDRLLQQQEEQQQQQQQRDDDTTSPAGSTQQQLQQQMLQQQVAFFAAQTLHVKCRSCRDVADLPPSSLPSLRDSLWAHGQAYTRKQYQQQQSYYKLVSTRLALCISALAVQMSWNTIITDILQMQQQQNNQPNNQQAKIDALWVLSILQLLPEECASEHLLLLNDHNRYIMRDHLVTTSAQVLQYLHHELLQTQQQQHYNNKHVVKILYAVTSWIRYVPVEPHVLVDTPLLPTAVQIVSTVPMSILNHNNNNGSENIELLEAATDVLVEILRMYPSHIAGNEALVDRLMQLLAPLPLDAVLQQQQQHLNDDNDSFEDVARAFCRIMTELGESYLGWIVSSHYQQASLLVERLLHCTRSLPSELASMTLNFWYRLVGDLEMQEPYEWRQELIDAYTPHLTGLVDACALHLMKFPPDVDDLPEDIMDDIHKHRHYVAETVEDCCRLLGGKIVLHRINILFRQQVQASTPAWQEIESCLACLCAIYRFVPSDDQELLPFCFQIIPQLPADFVPLRFTASKVVGKFASWLARQQAQIEPLFYYLTRGLTIKDCAPAAAVAIKELCVTVESTKLLQPMFQLYQEASGSVELYDELHLLEGICHLMATPINLKKNDAMSQLQSLVQPIGNQLAVNVSNPQAVPKLITNDVERLATIAQYYTPSLSGMEEHPIYNLIQSCWALLSTATDRFPNDSFLAEKVCSLHKHALRTCGVRVYAPLMDKTVDFYVANFAKSHQSAYLYAASILITEFAQNPLFVPQLLNMVSALATAYFSFMTSLSDYVNHPDVVEEFFYLMGRMLTYAPDPLVTSPLLPALLQCAAVGMQVDHKGSNKGTFKFLENMLSYGLTLRRSNKPEVQAAMESAIAQGGQAIVSNLARAMIGELPSYSSQLPDVVHILSELCLSQLLQWMSNTFASSTISEQLSQHFLRALQAGLSRDDLNLSIRDFQATCRKERRSSHMLRH